MSDNVAFSIEQLLSSVCNDRELAEQVLEVFKSDFPAQIEDLDKALLDGDARAAERISHSIKGASATIGGNALRDVAYECEKLGHEGRLEGIKERVPELLRQFEALCLELESSGF